MRGRGHSAVIAFGIQLGSGLAAEPLTVYPIGPGLSSLTGSAPAKKHRMYKSDHSFGLGVLMDAGAGEGVSVVGTGVSSGSGVVITTGVGVGTGVGVTTGRSSSA